jgi:N-acetylneuraminate lyase
MQLINRFGSPVSNAPAIKAMMRIIGMDCGPMRLPQESLLDDEVEALRVALDEIGFFNWGRQ